ncbi:hypothetical protein ACTFQF_00490 [Aliivibrio fischeri]|uniref:Uncharacterized protein n=1 Tax=Aliivibrio fischeri (strain MJ11) TaxID=388396 RepID=B5EVW1_ALIFM|nr:hypothetical protein [Aliivibrio fischeri]ACH64747.1 hypothetical protein VFMJ11_B0018 [Aliivibrio fischeri MJ11]MUK37533.1 hypothetical protein [Aliivibrio fischeri]
MTQTLSLQEHRCPYAMSIMRRAIESAIDAKYTGLITIETIEKSMQNHLLQFIDSYELPIEINECYNVPITQKYIDSCCNTGSAIPEDFIGINDIHTIQLYIGKKK